MTVNMYSVVKSKGFSKTIVSFTDKEEAEKHAETLDCFGAKEYMVVPSEVTLFLPTST